MTWIKFCSPHGEGTQECSSFGFEGLKELRHLEPYVLWTSTSATCVLCSLGWEVPWPFWTSVSLPVKSCCPTQCLFSNMFPLPLKVTFIQRKKKKDKMSICCLPSCPVPAPRQSPRGWTRLGQTGLSEKRATLRDLLNGGVVEGCSVLKSLLLLSPC